MDFIFTILYFTSLVSISYFSVAQRKPPLHGAVFFYRNTTAILFHSIFECFAGLEFRYRRCRNLDLLSGLRVDALARCAL